MRHFNWTPGIGDPTIGGWITVVLYALATASCWMAARRPGNDLRERYIWCAITLLFLALGINKQLDLQTALTELGRVLADAQGWYARRRSVQVRIHHCNGAACIAATVTLLIWARKSSRPTWLALTGVMLVLGFVLIRAASFHHFDLFIHSRILGLRWNWVFGNERNQHCSFSELLASPRPQVDSSSDTKKEIGFLMGCLLLPIQAISAWPPNHDQLGEVRTATEPRTRSPSANTLRARLSVLSFLSVWQGVSGTCASPLGVRCWLCSWWQGHDRMPSLPRRSFSSCPNSAQRTSCGQPSTGGAGSALSS